MIIKSIKLNKKFIFTSIVIFILIVTVSSFFMISNSIEINSMFFWDKTQIDLEEHKDFIKWIDFKVTSEAMIKTSKLDIESHNSNSEIKYNWIELLAYLACKNGGNFKNFNQNELNKLINKLNNR